MPDTTTTPPIAAPVVQTFNEWDPLEEVIVGTVRGAMYPPMGPILAANREPSWLWHYQGELVEEDLVEQAAEQLDALVETLEDAGVTVHRPDPMPHNVGFSTPFWQSRSGWNSANPRDLFLVVGDTILECASPLRHRHFETLAYQRLMTHYFRQGAHWVSAPRPALRAPLYDHSALALGPDPPPLPEALNPDTPHAYPITEHELVFEAADFARCGRDLFVTQSHVTNRLGIQWVQRQLGPDFRVHVLDTRCPNPCHIDTTFVPLRPKTALVHPRWFGRPIPALDGWTLIPAPAPVYSDDSPMANPYFTSQWLSMNVLSIDPERVLVDAQQQPLIRLLVHHGFDVIPLDFDAVGAFGGSFHCATLDIRRRGTLG